MPTSDEATTIGYLLAAAILGGVIGWLLRGSKGVITESPSEAPRTYTPGELELFTTPYPDRYPAGRRVTIQAGPHTVTRLLDRGSFRDIDGNEHHRWAVLGRPA